MNYMPIDRWLIFTTIINDVRYGREKEFTMTGVRKEWSHAIRSYNKALNNGHNRTVVQQ